MIDDREEQARKHLRTWSHLSDTGDYVESVFMRVCAERDAAIARAERAEAEQTSLAIDAARVAVARDEAVARAEAAEALAASRPEVSPEIAAYWYETVPVGALRAALRAHAAKVSR